MKKLLVLFCATSILDGPSVGAQEVKVASGSVAEAVAKLRPGEFVWAPEIAPTGPTLLIVNVKTQRAVLFRNGIPIAASTVSTGKPGYRTPTGVFTILQKHVEHYSSTYDNAPMPYMQRLTWRGVAIHAGKLPGFPASHGCVRLPQEFAKLLFGVTSLGMTVVVTDKAATPRIAPTPNLTMAGPMPASAETLDWHPERSPSGPVSIVVSAADRRAVVLRSGVPIGTGVVEVNGGVTGTWAYALRAIDDHGQQWVRLDLGDEKGNAAVSRQEWQRFAAAPAFKKAVASVLQPGTTIVVTPDSLKAGSTGTSLTVLEGDRTSKSDGVAPAASRL
ncbi:L,D-transpeptidase family protein [Sphingomonas piscis]|uniref:L,D-transpeptidase family protein n=1 Tax=Sphingomonas piscis TaxID=2714943 RepID=A0A6G7YPK2_9SPHN|nr:L,D-transpeptidase family protein [Sphingomonas piscis]QIK78670.1 L,D-transpeptidase family protein [Sphingomonas piscis]